MALELTIVTPEGEAFANAIESVVLPGTEGEFGVLEAHERLLTALQPGPVEIRGADGAASQWAAVTDGFVEVTGEQVVVLVDHCILAGDIDAATAEKDRAEAAEELRGLSGAEENETRREELEKAIAIAEVRIDVAGRTSA